MNNFLELLSTQLKNEFLTTFISTLVKGVDYYEVLNKTKLNLNGTRGCYSWMNDDGKIITFTKATQIKFENEYTTYINNKSVKLFNLLKGE